MGFRDNVSGVYVVERTLDPFGCKAEGRESDPCLEMLQSWVLNLVWAMVIKDENERVKIHDDGEVR